MKQLDSNIIIKTYYFLAGLYPGSKIDKANKLGVQIITEDEINGLISRD